MYGYAGKIAFIDLGKKKVTIEEPDEGMIKEYLGGIGFLTRLLYDMVPKGATLYQKMGDVGAYNWQHGVFDKFDAIEGDNYRDRYSVGSGACGCCPLPCWRKYLIKEGRFSGQWTEAIENSTVQCFGTRVGNADPEVVLVAHTLCDKHSLDEISVGVSIAFAMECYQKGIITARDTGGLELTWGNGDVILRLIDMIARNEGIGKILGQGVKRTAEQFGHDSDKFAYHVKGLEISTVDPRAYQGWALGYAVSARGADHMRSYATWEFGDIPEETREEAGLPETMTDRFSVEGNGKGVAYSENIRSIADCLEMCKTVTRQKLGLTKNQVGILTAVTGRGWTKEELFRVGERKVNLERLFNLREGLTPTDDTLPWRALHEPLPDGASEGRVVDLEPMLKEYYEARDWDRTTGCPSPAKLKELNL